MKKTIVLTLLILSFAGSAFAAQFVSLISASIKGGADAATAAAATNALVRLSTNVIGVVNYTPDAATKTAPGYSIVTKHTSGSKMFGTANDSTNIYWKNLAAGTPLTGALAGSTDGSGNFTVAGSGWTSY